jgi:Ca-activated chloride channel family protein
MSNPRTFPLEQIKLGQIVVADELASPLPLEGTDVTGQVLGPLVSVSVVQRFGNPLAEPAEIDYLFPLPHEAAIIDFELRIGERTIKGDLQELEQARAAYEAAREEGKRAGLLEQRRPNLFSVRIANVLPAETIHASMRYQARLNYDDGGYTFVFPMGITPKYQDPDHPDEGAGTDAPLAAADEPIGPVEITLAVDAGAAAGDPASPSHPIELTRLDERRFTVRLAGHHIPDHDFVLRYPVACEAVAAAAWAAQGDDGDYFMATVLPPALGEEATPPPRDLVFVLDRSGSMSGQPIAQARNALRACLRTLNPGDLFRILLFDHQLEWFRPEPSPITQAEIDAADAYLSRIEGRGGTRIVEALKAALTLPADRERLRYVVFLTDGAVSAEERALDQVRRQLGAARVFTFGIGPSVNRALLARLASLGRGTAEFLGLDEDIEGAIIRFQDRVSFPVLTDLALTWKNGRTWDVHPQRLPDLYVGQPLEIVGRLRRSGRGGTALIVDGKLDGKTLVEMTVALPAESDPEPIVARAWARARVDDLLEAGATGSQEAHKVRAEIIGLALEHRLVTPYTAFVAVDSEVAVREGRARTIRVSQPLPQGLELEGFIGQRAMGRAMMLNAPMSLDAGLALRAPSAAPPRVNRVGLGDMKRRLAEVMSAPAAAKYAALDVDRTPTPEELPAADDLAGLLRWLARTQNVNGSWADDAEMTAAALLAFVRAGHTTNSGHYRQQVRRAIGWLRTAPAAGFAAFARAVALAELAVATGSQAHQQAAAAALEGLVSPQNPLEAAALARAKSPTAPLPGPDGINNLNDLRLAGVCGRGTSVPASLLGEKRAALARTWAATIAR